MENKFKYKPSLEIIAGLMSLEFRILAFQVKLRTDVNKMRCKNEFNMSVIKFNHMAKSPPFQFGGLLSRSIKESVVK